jgi:hypothetical protein
MKSSSAKAKGKLLEDYVADQIVLKGIDLKARRDNASGSGTREKGDISTSMMVLGQNAGIECKNQATLHIPNWWKQTKKLESLGREPILVFKQYGESLGDSKAIVYLDTLLELIKLSNTEKIYQEVIPEDSNTKKWAIQNAINSLKKLLKEYEKLNKRN